MKVAIASVVVPEGRRLRRDVTQLAASIRELGLLQAIGITKGNELVFGAHRLEACRSLGWSQIDANVVEFSEAQIDALALSSGQVAEEITRLLTKQAEIDENLKREDLTALERAEQTAERKTIYEALYPETRSVNTRGGPGRGNKTNPDSGLVSRSAFTDDTAAKTGRGRSTVAEDARIGKALAPDVRDTIRGTDLANNKRELLDLAKREPATQRHILKSVRSGEHKSVRDAMDAMGDRSPAAIERDALTAVSLMTKAGTREALARAWHRVETLASRGLMPSNVRAMAESTHAARVATFDHHDGTGVAYDRTPLEVAAALGSTPVPIARASGGDPVANALNAVAAFDLTAEQLADLMHQLALRLPGDAFRSVMARLRAMEVAA